MKGKRKMSKPLTKTALLATAKTLDIKGLSKKTKPEIIHAIQLAEGNVDCFGKIPTCTLNDCMFRADCIPA